MQRVWEAVSTVEWLATVGIPLALTLLTVIFSLLFVRVQMRQDRKIAAEDRKFASGQRRALRAERIADVLEAAINRIGSDFEYEREYDAAFWASEEWPDVDDVRRAADDLFEIFLSTINTGSHELRRQLRQIEESEALLSSRAAVIANEWHAIRALELRSDELSPSGISPDSWNDEMLVLRQGVIRARSEPLRGLVRDLREWEGQMLMKYRMNPATDHSLIYRDAAESVGTLDWASAYKARCAMSDYVGVPSEEDELVDEHRLSYSVRMDMLRTVDGSIVFDASPVQLLVDRVLRLVRRTH